MIMAAPFPKGFPQLEHNFFPLTDLLGAGGSDESDDGGQAAAGFDGLLLSTEPLLRSPAGRPGGAFCPWTPCWGGAGPEGGMEEEVKEEVQEEEGGSFCPFCRLGLNISA